MNWGTFFGWAGAILALTTSVGYLFHRDYRKALYFFFAFCITVVQVW